MGLTIQEIKGLFVLNCVLDVVALILLVSLFGHQLGDKLRQLAFDRRIALVIKLVVAKVYKQTGKEFIFFFIADPQTYIFSDGFRHLFSVDTDGILARQAQIPGERAR